MRSTATLAAISAVVDGLTTALEAAFDDVVVVDGYGVGDAGFDKVVNVGIDDPASEALATSAQSEIDWATIGQLKREEQGNLWLAVTCTTGSSELRPCRDTVQEILEEIRNWLGDHLDLGLAELFQKSGITQVLVQQQQDNEGAFVAVALQISFEARL